MSMTIGGKQVASITIGGKTVSTIGIGGKIVEIASTPAFQDYFYLQAVNAGSTVSMQNYSNTPSIEYSTDGTNWTSWDYSAITLANVGDKVYFKGNNSSGLNNGIASYSKFVMTGKLKGGGNINSLLSTSDERPSIPNTCYYKLFYGCTALTKAPSMPSLTVGSDAYYEMYRGSGLTSTPDLPATTLGDHCYYGMFRECTSLTTAMTNLPATTLATYCYSNMFRGCTALTEAPALKAPSLESGSYECMFYGCSVLAKIKVYATSWVESRAENWVVNVRGDQGSFYKKSAVNIPTSASGIPTNWTVYNTL